MSEVLPSVPVRRHTMRNLRTGRVQSEVVPKPVGRGSVVSEKVLLEGLTAAIAEAVELQQSVFVFHVHGCLIPLQQWNDLAALPEGRIDSAIEKVIVDQDQDLVVAKTDGRGLLGFRSQPLSSADAERFGGRLLLAMAAPMGEPGREFVISPRLGVAVVDQAHVTAEMAVESVTRTLRQTNFETPFLIHNDYVQKRSIRQDRVGEELPSAMMAEQITVEFQPRITAPGRVPVGLEVFPRWHHEEQGTIPAVEFLRVAEQTGMLVDLGHYIRRVATDVASEWGWSRWLKECRLWMNIAPVELCDADLLPSILAVRNDHPDIPLGLEVTDVRLLEDPVFIRIFDRLAEAGIMLALDNLRSSALSIGRIQRLPMSMINLDGELVRSLPHRPAHRALVRFLCSYARSEDKLVTACGVETAEQLRLATSLGVHLVQGNAVTEPLPGDEIAARLRGGSGGADRRASDRSD